MQETFDISNEIGHLARRITDKKAQSDFLCGFEEELKKTQMSSHLIPVHENLKNGFVDAYSFGKSLGSFIGILRFHPRKIIQSSEHAQHFLESLDCLSGLKEFHHFAREKFHKWSKRVRPHFRDLEEVEKRAYMFLIRWI